MPAAAGVAPKPGQLPAPEDMYQPEDGAPLEPFIPSVKQAVKKAVKKAEEDALSGELTVMKRIFVLDTKLNIYVAKEVVQGGPDDPDTEYTEITDEDDLTEFDPADLSLVWAELGRGQMQWRWIHQNDKYGSRDTKLGFRRVDPDAVKIPHLGSSIKTLPGIGKAYTYMDTYLTEMPKAAYDRIRAAQYGKQKQAELARLLGTDEWDKDVHLRSDKLVTIKRDEWGSKFNEIGEGTNPAVQEIASLEREIARMERLTGRRSPSSAHMLLNG